MKLSQQPWNARKRYEAGVWAIPLALAPGFLLSALFSVPPPLEPLTEFVMQATPISIANVLLAALGSFARAAALLGAIAICLPIGGSIALLAPGTRGKGSALRWGATVTLALLVAVLLAWAAAYTAEAGGSILAGLLFTPALLLTRGWQGRAVRAVDEAQGQSDKQGQGRRAFLRSMAGSAFTVTAALALGAFDSWSGALGGLLGRNETLRTLFHFVPPAPRKAGFPVAGEEPEVTPVEHFYLIDKNDIDPLIEPDQWSLYIAGQVSQPLRLSYAQLLAMPRVDAYVTLRCIDNLPETHLMSNAYWSGVPLATLLQYAGASPKAAAIKIHAPDGYDEILPTEAALYPDTLIAYGMNGATLPRIHGGPVRLIAPGFYGFKNVKWVESIEVSTNVEQGYWAARGYTAARVHSVARIDVWHPTPGGLVVGGVAFAGTQGVSAVELRVNSGAWQQAELHIPALSQMSWVQWRIALALAPGTHTLTARMIDGHGQVQTPQNSNVYPDGSTGLHTVSVTVGK